MEEKEILTPDNEMNINADADVPGNTHLSNEGAEDVTEKLQAEVEEHRGEGVDALKEARVRQEADFERRHQDHQRRLNGGRQGSLENQPRKDHRHQHDDKNDADPEKHQAEFMRPGKF